MKWTEIHLPFDVEQNYFLLIDRKSKQWGEIQFLKYDCLYYTIR